MQTAIHFCSVTFSNNLVLTPINAWEKQEDKVMFIVCTEEQLENAVIQLVADNTVVWESPLRLVPENGVEHPFTAEDDYSIEYISSRFATKVNLSVETEMYFVQVVNATENATISEMPFTIEFFRPEEQEESINIETIHHILASDLDISSEQNVETTIVEEESTVVEPSATHAMNFIQNEVPVNVMQDATEPLNELVQEHTESLTELGEQPQDVANVTETEVEEQPVEQVFSHELHYNPKIVGDILVAVATQTDYSVNYRSSVRTVMRDFPIVIEKIGEKYIAVINDPAARPMFFLENGKLIKEWTEGVNSYIEWLKDQLSLMFNISLEESSNWDILLIAEEEVAVENAKVVVANRYNLIAEITQYAAILDVTVAGSVLTLCFTDGATLTFQFANLTSIEQVQEVLPKWQEVLSGTYILPTGLLADPDVVEGLSDQLKKASKYRRTSLAWEYVIQLSKQQ